MTRQPRTQVGCSGDGQARTRETHEAQAPRVATCSSLDAAQRASFAERGWLRLRAALSRADALRMQARMWDELRAVHGIARERRETWYQPRATLRAAKRDPLQQAIASAALLGAIDTLLGAHRWRVPSSWGIVLVTFPDRSGDAWTVPTSGWHYDFDLLDNATALRGLQVFAFLGRVVEHGGATLVVEGSHLLATRFVASLSPEDRACDHQTLRRRFLRHDPWLRALTGRAAAPADRVACLLGASSSESGLALRVVELTGEPGDVIVCHPLLLHVASRNVAAEPRFMRSKRICCEPSQDRDEHR